MVMHHIWTERNRRFGYVRSHEHSAAGHEIAEQQLVRKPRSREKHMVPTNFRNAVRRLVPFPINHVHVRTDQQCAGLFGFIFQNLQFLRQPDIILIAVRDVLTARLLRQPLKRLVRASIALIA